MKKLSLVCSALMLLAPSVYAQDLEFNVVIKWDTSYSDSSNVQGSACNRDGMKVANIQGNSIETLIRKLEGQTDLLRSELAKEGFIITPGHNIVISELESRACQGVRFPEACRRAVNFEERVDGIFSLYQKYERELGEYRRLMAGYSSEEHARRTEEADRARARAEHLESRLDEKLSDLREMEMVLNTVGIQSLEGREFLENLKEQIRSKKQQEVEEVRLAKIEAEKKEVFANDYRPASNRSVVEAKRDLITRIQNTVDEYRALKAIVNKNDALATKRNPISGHPNNSYDNEMRCAANVFDELVEDINRLAIR